MASTNAKSFAGYATVLGQLFPEHECIQAISRILAVITTGVFRCRTV